RSKLSLVEYAFKQWAEMAKNGDRIDEFWCVFDMDFSQSKNKHEQDFDNAIKKIESLNIKYSNNSVLGPTKFKAAWSNDSIELLYLLHNEEQNAYILRTDINNRLKKIWNLTSTKEIKKDVFCDGLYNLLNKKPANRGKAIERA